jgi:hypothetical protein
MGGSSRAGAGTGAGTGAGAGAGSAGGTGERREKALVAWIQKEVTNPNPNDIYTHTRPLPNFSHTHTPFNTRPPSSPTSSIPWKVRTASASHTLRVQLARESELRMVATKTLAALNGSGSSGGGASASAASHNCSPDTSKALEEELRARALRIKVRDRVLV